MSIATLLLWVSGFALTLISPVSGAPTEPVSHVPLSYGPCFMQPALWNPALVGPLPQCPTDGSWSPYRIDTGPSSTRTVTAGAVPRPDLPVLP